MIKNKLNTNILSKTLLDLLKQKNYIHSDILILYRIYSVFFENLTNQESISFTSLFARISFVSTKFNFPARLTFNNHKFRKVCETNIKSVENIREFIEFGIYLIQENLKIIEGMDLQLNVPSPDIIDVERKSLSGFKRVIKGLINKWTQEDDKDVFEFIDEEIPHKCIKVEIADKDFERQLRAVCKNLYLPYPVNLINVEIADEVYFPAAIVIQPDFMIGVTSVSECFQSGGSYALKYFVNKLVPSPPSIYMLIGNVVNHFLDELIYDPNLLFKDVVKDIFKLAPESFALLDDKQLSDVISKVKIHFENLKRVVTVDLKEAGISQERSYLEPSFYSGDYGISGRLDLYHQDHHKGQSDIVELKSGRLYRANSYGLNENHYIQTLLYDMIIESVYEGKVKSNNYILYSALQKERLRYAPRVRKKQYDACKIRNDIIMIEFIMQHLHLSKFDYIFDSIQPQNIPADFNFVRKNAVLFDASFKNLSLIEKEYYRAFTAFLSKEYELSKIGEHGIHKLNGLASLWLDPLDEKIANFSVLSYLKVSSIEADNSVPRISFTYSEKSNILSKFRMGDIVVLYPSSENQTDILKHQIFKCSILEIDDQVIKVRLRARQKNKEIFQAIPYWNIESDVLDSGFQKQFHSLFDFLNSSQAYRRKILTLDKPDEPAQLITHRFEQVTDEQQDLLNKAIAAKDYFLLWGPPGTGKTSIMVKNLVNYYYKNSDKNILLLAYTNRAVDELCHAIEDISEGNFLRIGSRDATDSRFKSHLFNTRISDIHSRASLIELIDQNRIWLSTVSSFQSKSELMQLKRFDLVIIDEASQLLEPMLVGFLSKFEKFILIGDHKQLPAVVAQEEENLIEPSQSLQANVGLYNCKISLFERLYMQALQNNWNHAFGSLSYQGRMHQDILKFISGEFYEGKLKVLQGVDRLVSEYKCKQNNSNDEFLISNRMIFVNTEIDESVVSKVNHKEAILVKKVIEKWIEIYNNNEKSLTVHAIGVITPFRSQIARIKKEITGVPKSELITVDTIERYQGGSRDQIIISLAVNQADMVDSISNISKDGIDRKLNVALTRAKEHIVIFGSGTVLKAHPSYSNLIKYCKYIEAEDFMEIINQNK